MDRFRDRFSPAGAKDDRRVFRSNSVTFTSQLTYELSFVIFDEPTGSSGRTPPAGSCLLAASIRLPTA